MLVLRAKSAEEETDAASWLSNAADVIANKMPVEDDAATASAPATTGIVDSSSRHSVVSADSANQPDRSPTARIVLSHPSSSPSDDDDEEDDDEDHDDGPKKPLSLASRRPIRPRGRFSKAEKRILFGLIRADLDLLHSFLHQVKRRVWDGKSWMHEIATKFNTLSPKFRSHDAVRHHLKLRRPPVYSSGRASTPQAQELRDLTQLLQHHAHCAQPDACARCLQLCRLRVKRGLARCGLETCDRCDPSLPAVLAPIDARELLKEVGNGKPAPAVPDARRAGAWSQQRANNKVATRRAVVGNGSSSSSASSGAMPARQPREPLQQHQQHQQQPESLLEHLRGVQERLGASSQWSASEMGRDAGSSQLQALLSGSVFGGLGPLQQQLQQQQQQQQRVAPGTDMDAQLLSILLQSPLLGAGDRETLMKQQMERTHAVEIQLAQMRRQQLVEAFVRSQQAQQAPLGPLEQLRLQHLQQQQQQQQRQHTSAQLSALQLQLERAVAAQTSLKRGPPQDLSALERSLAADMSERQKQRRTDSDSS